MKLLLSQNLPSRLRDAFATPGPMLFAFGRSV
jgi:hypothetical protein